MLKHFYCLLNNYTILTLLSSFYKRLPQQWEEDVPERYRKDGGRGGRGGFRGRGGRGFRGRGRDAVQTGKAPPKPVDLPHRYLVKPEYTPPQFTRLYYVVCVFPLFSNSFSTVTADTKKVPAKFAGLILFKKKMSLRFLIFTILTLLL